MDIYKQYIYKLRNLALKEPYIYLLNDDIIPKLKQYIHELNSITFNEDAYHIYYGEIKTIVNSFNIYWTDKMDDAIKEADRCSHCINFTELTEMAHKTIAMQKVKQEDFENEFLPFNTTLEEQAYKNVVEKYNVFMKSLEEFTENLKRLDKQDKVVAFAKEHFPLSLKRKNEVFVFTHNFISIKLSLVIDRIRISIEEIFKRIQNNVRSIQEQSDSSVSDLLMQLYEKNKEHLNLSRLDTRTSVELAEVQRSIELIKDKIVDSKQLPFQRLQEEYKYWEDKILEFKQIYECIKNLREAETRILEQEKLYNSMKYNEIPEPNQKCWVHMGNHLKAKLQEIKELKLNAAKALQTFFSVRGSNRVFYSDNIGRYYLDEYGHQCYVINYGHCIYHVNCQGEFVDIPDKDKYFYDEMGRFHIDKETQEKLYHVAPCSSSYRIENDVFVKHSKDCGHSEANNKHCQMLVRDPNDVVILPAMEPVGIQGKLDSEAVKYLWDSFGHILPEALHDVAEQQPKNPIHALAHKLLVYKYKRTCEETDRKKKEADLYRTKIYQDRLEKASTTYKAWKKKQTQRRKPEEIDDHEEKMAFNKQREKQDFVQTYINYDT